jgi:hypothetical protein
MELPTINTTRHHIVADYHGTDHACRDGSVDSLCTARAVHHVSYACDPSTTGSNDRSTCQHCKFYATRSTYIYRSMQCFTLINSSRVIAHVSFSDQSDKAQ